ncbi:MAG: hypothetical protein Ta2A_13670 [Treponemataceae bacterium]|nr:MAG: hypothetical protein Ta2A_13670 [Treponemataceae bacterium]
MLYKITGTKTKLFLIAVVLAFFGASRVSALSVGAEITGGLPLFYGGSVLVSTSDMHHFGLGAVAKGGEPVLTAHWDTRLFEHPLSETSSGSIRFFMGPGLATAFLLRGSFSMSFSLRSTVGFDFDFQTFAVFVQLASEVGAVLHPWSFPTWSAGAAVGARWRIGK